MTSGLATPLPLGPCKRCEKARVECTSTNAATSTTSTTRREASNNDRYPKQAKTTNTKDSSNAATCSSSTAGSSELTTFSPLARPSLNILNSTLTDPSLFLENFDFDLDVGGGEHFDHFDIAPTIAGGLPSPKKSQESISNKAFRIAEQFRNEDSEIVDENASARSELLNTPPTESLVEWSSQDAPQTAADTSDRMPCTDPLTETLDRLSELQTFIFKNFGSIPEGSLVSTFMSPDIGSCHSLASASPDSNLVGKVLYASERLIDILTSCGRHEANLPQVRTPLRPRSDTRSGSKRSYANLLGRDDTRRADTSSPRTSNSITTHGGFLRKNTFGDEGTPSFPRTTADTKLHETSLYSGLLSPAKLTLLTCYITLLSVYRLILSQAFDILRSDCSQASPSATLRGSTFRAPEASVSAQLVLNSATIMGFRMQLEMLTHT